MSEYCFEGRLICSVPATWTDPPDEEDVGECPRCRGVGCDHIEAYEAMVNRLPDEEISYGIR